MGMEEDNSQERSEKSSKNKAFNPQRYGMVLCPLCKGKGFVIDPKRQCCPKCEGFGFIKKEEEQNKNIPTSNQ